MTSDNGDCETSYFTSNPVTGPAIPPICGGNDGLHLYMDAGAYYDDQSTFSVVVGESGLDWKILVGIAFFLNSMAKICPILLMAWAGIEKNALSCR